MEKHARKPASDEYPGDQERRAEAAVESALNHAFTALDAELRSGVDRLGIERILDQKGLIEDWLNWQEVDFSSDFPDQ
ncbi:hypothetical protein [uncultured Pseudokineococcus sp.]|uniref:hypothetical protein n=1 Tax=uncultured Pseudokineococcus sp. TaxID=1642928 RepID=UPI00262E668A|nr:hypothetical protein [uncultured Pseudokineococcus sp.]